MRGISRVQVVFHQNAREIDVEIGIVFEAFEERFENRRALKVHAFAGQAHDDDRIGFESFARIFRQARYVSAGYEFRRQVQGFAGGEFTGGPLQQAHAMISARALLHVHHSAFETIAAAVFQTHYDQVAVEGAAGVRRGNEDLPGDGAGSANGDETGPFRAERNAAAQIKRFANFDFGNADESNCAELRQQLQDFMDLLKVVLFLFARPGAAFRFFFRSRLLRSESGICFSAIRSARAGRL